MKKKKCCECDSRHLAKERGSMEKEKQRSHDLPELNFAQHCQKLNLLPSPLDRMNKVHASFSNHPNLCFNFENFNFPLKKTQNQC
jgi:hypothetical protein